MKHNLYEPWDTKHLKHILTCGIEHTSMSPRARKMQTDVIINDEKQQMYIALYILPSLRARSRLKLKVCGTVSLKGKVSSKMTYNFYWPDRISIVFENFFCNLLH